MTQTEIDELEFVQLHFDEVRNGWRIRAFGVTLWLLGCLLAPIAINFVSAILWSRGWHVLSIAVALEVILLFPMIYVVAQDTRNIAREHRVINKARALLESKQDGKGRRETQEATSKVTQPQGKETYRSNGAAGG